MDGPGWHIDPETLLPVLTDEAAFRAAHADDPAVEALVALWSGDPVRAERVLDELVARGLSPRLLALRADAWRDQGRRAEAVAAFERLLDDCDSVGREATFRQHLGKVHLVAGDLGAAEACFAAALALREQTGAAPDLVASSRLALERVKALRGAAPRR